MNPLSTLRPFRLVSFIELNIEPDNDIIRNRGVVYCCDVFMLESL